MIKKTDLIKTFFKKSLENLNSKKVFYKYHNKIYSYIDLKNFYNKFLNFLHKLKNERKKIVIISEKSFEMYACILSIILSKNIWIPINVNLPQNRIVKILNECQADCIIVDQNKDKKYLFIKNYCRKKKIIFTDFFKIQKIPINKKIHKKIDIKDKDTSMIFFTSGSTGEPKGVIISYKGFLNSLFEQNRILYKNNKNLVFGDYHDPSFIISLNILFLCFFTKSIISPGIDPYESFLPINHIKQNKVNVLITVPSTIVRLKNYLKNENFLHKFKLIILCGEPFHLDLYKFMIEKMNSKDIFNLYGSTELSPWVFSHKCAKKDLKIFDKFKLMPIGKPFRHTKVLLLKNELLISGRMLSEGYIKKIENTDKFIKIKNIRWYKTGDISEIHKNYFIIKGRKDRVVKIKGYRIDLTEIEKFLRDINTVQNVICFVKENGNKKSISCIIQCDKKISIDMLITHLKKHVPFYMIPKEFNFLKKFSINKSGKIDRKNIIKLY